ncbi:MAG: ABC-F family ATP-binding cassette domain-containing protein [Bdellovibrionaceae bacterium]|nr:ABC-F family ATP-binding cassette domain-containing protein [Bdellovibrio sp.]
MATLISAYQLSKSFASKTLFQSISFAIDTSEHIGLIGPNGAGKSTLLSLLSKQQKADDGQISFAQNLRMGYLMQKPTFPKEDSIYGALMSVVDDQYDSENLQLAYELISKLELDQFPDGVEKLISTLSGGWQKKVALARELMKRPNLLLLDEPTNHLDLESILWLEDFLNKQSSLALLTVTHDRRFLQNTCQIIFDLDPRLPQGLLRTNGSYDQHIDNKMQLVEGQKRLEDKRRNTMKIEKDWLARGPQARLTKQKARIDRAYDLIDEVAHLKNQNKTTNLNLDFGSTEKSPKKLIAAENIGKSFQDRLLFENFTTFISPGHRYGLIGPNGCGKSTLLKCLMGKEPVDSGDVFVNEDIEVSYFEQGKDTINPQISVLKAICPEGDYVHFQDEPVFARSYLSRFYFRAQQMDMPVGQLSGGELSRLILAKLMLKKAHVLILDEPTNDLDVETLETLADCLVEFRGAVILVSHDRYFMDQNCDVIWAFDMNAKQIVTFADTIQWEIWFKQNQNKKAVAPSKSSGKSSSEKKGLSNKEKIEFEKIETVIASEEKNLVALQAELAKLETQSNFARLSELTTQIANTEGQIEKLFKRWEELTAKNITS